MDVKNVFLNRYLNVEVNHDVSNDVTDMDGVIEKYNNVEVCQNIITDVNNIKSEIRIIIFFVNVSLFQIMSSTLLDHLFQQIQDEFEMGMVSQLAYLSAFQVIQKKDYTFDSQSINAGSSRT